jgi:hypothetical protein
MICISVFENFLNHFQDEDEFEQIVKLVFFFIDFLSLRHWHLLRAGSPAQGV